MNSLNYRKLTPTLYCLRYNKGGCSRKKCTALRLKKFYLIKLIKKIEGKTKESIILDPFAQDQITFKDRDIILKKGLVVIDCSWNKLLNLKRINWINGRKLPSLRAVNPINYGKWEKLSSAEAIAAALYITKFNDLACLILSKFTWGNHFTELNNF
ncbi:MAG: DUF367 family protein [Promethearchaeota archaeon]